MRVNRDLAVRAALGAKRHEVSLIHGSPLLQPTIGKTLDSQQIPTIRPTLA